MRKVFGLLRANSQDAAALDLADRLRRIRLNRKAHLLRRLDPILVVLRLQTLFEGVVLGLGRCMRRNQGNADECGGGDAIEPHHGLAPAAAGAGAGPAAGAVAPAGAGAAGRAAVSAAAATGSIGAPAEPLRNCSKYCSTVTVSNRAIGATATPPTLTCALTVAVFEFGPVKLI